MTSKETYERLESSLAGTLAELDIGQGELTRVLHLYAKEARRDKSTPGTIYWQDFLNNCRSELISDYLPQPKDVTNE